MDKINPYQSPQVEEVSPGEAEQTERPTILMSSLFGLYCGAVCGATCAGVAMMLLASGLAIALGENSIAAAVGGAYFGVIAGGFAGAVFGSPLAVIARLRRPRPDRWFFAQSALLFTFITAMLGLWMLMRMNWLVRYAMLPELPSDVEWRVAKTITISASLAIGAIAGLAAGLLFARRCARFVFPEKKRPVAAKIV